MLKITNLNSYYGKVHVLKGVDINIEEGQIVTLLGPNGAGKTTTMMSVSGLVKMSGGSHIMLDEKELVGKKPETIVKQGVIHVPQGRGVFSGLTVRENLIMGAYLRKSKREIEGDIEEIIEMFPRLKKRYKQLAGTLSGGEQQMLAIMRGLMAKPKLLMLDEPSMGLAPIIVEQIYETIANINKSGTTIFLVEQNTNMALQVSNYGYVLSSGMIASEGKSCDLRENEEMLQSYFKGQDKS